MKMLKKIISLAVTIVFVLSCFAGCSDDKISEDEARIIAKDLIEASVPINEIFFGYGLPYDKESEYILDYYDKLDVDIESAPYLPVAENAPYHSIDEIKAAASKVYSADYCEYLFEMAFVGFSNDIGDVYLAKYIEEYDFLTVKVESDPLVPQSRTFDYDSIVFKKIAKNYIILTIDSFVNGEKSDQIRIKLVREKLPEQLSFHWRLDTPTY